MDFGLARDSGGNATKGLTESGAVMGTPAYMSPEQARGDAKRLDRRSDVYSLGATLYDVLTGKPPFEDQTVVNILLKVMNDSPTPARNHDPRIPEPVELIVSKCLNKEPEMRYATALALAEDLERFLTSQRVVARRLSYAYRLHYWARNNRTLATVAAALLLCLLGFSGFGIRTRIAALRKEAEAKKEAELAQKLGQSVKDLEWLMRTSYLLPLHDTRYEKRIVRARMEALTAELPAAAETGARLGAYVIGRGHLALHEWEAAHAALKRASQLGYRDAELDYALGRVLGELYSRALADARKSGDKSFFEKRKAELRAEYLGPALAYLQQSRRLTTISTSYVEALIDYYEQRYDAALLNAHLARQQEPWLYESAKLEGDVFLSRALDQRDHGDNDQAEQSFAAAIARYDQAAAVGHSDPEVHEAEAEAWTRWEEMETYAGRDPAPKFQRAIAAAERAIEAAPTESHGYTKKAFAYFFLAQFAQQKGQADRSITLYEQQIKHGQAALHAHADDAYAQDACGIGYMKLAEQYLGMHRPVEEVLGKAYLHFESALKLQPKFPWAYNDYAISLNISAGDRISHNKDPQDLLNQAISFLHKAIVLDPQYIFAHNTLAASYYYTAAWRSTHGQDPSSAVEHGIDAAEAALKINPTFAYAFGNIGFLQFSLANYHYELGQDPTVDSLKSIQAYQHMIDINKNFPYAYRCLALVYHLLAQHELSLAHDPSNTIREGLRAVESCYAIEAKSGLCQGAQGQLLAVQAAWLKHRGQPFVATLQQAHTLAQQATHNTAETDELWLPLAEISQQYATALWAAGKQPLAELKIGGDALEQAAKLSTGEPRAQALRGAILLLRAKLETIDAHRRELLRDSQQSFTAAFAGNPLLRRRYAELGAESDRLAAVR